MVRFESEGDGGAFDNVVWRCWWVGYLENSQISAIDISPTPRKNEYPPQPKPSAEAPPPRVCHSVREVPELPDVPDLHRRPPFGSAQ